MIRIEAVWLATAPLDMRCGPDTALARVVKVFGLPWQGLGDAGVIRVV